MTESQGDARGVAVDPALLQRYLLRELTDAESAEVESRVAEDPGWAAALASEAQLELLILDAAADVAARERAARPADVAPPESPWWERALAALRGPAGFALAAVAAAWLVVVLPDRGASPAAVTWTVDPVLGEVAQRSSTPDAAPVPTFSEGSQIAVTLRPSTRPKAGVAPRIDLAVDGVAVASAGRVEVAPEGAVSVRLVVGRDLPPLAPGEHRLSIQIQGEPHEVVFRVRGP
jgi:hypothetical protein